MPEITDPRLLAQIHAQRAQQPVNVQPQPFPGAEPMVFERNPSKVDADRQAATRTEIDVHGDRRADAALKMEAERLRIAQEKAARDRATAVANGGVDTTSQGETAAGHATSMLTNMQLIKDATTKDPSAAKPGLLEVIGKSVLPVDYQGFVESPQRQVVSQSYGPILESAVYLATGAAAQKEQVERLAAALVPLASDKEPALRAKAIRLQAEIEKARNMAGAADPKVLKALGQLESMFPQMYGVTSQEAKTAWGQEGPQQMELSTDRKSVPIPPEMQAEYSHWMAQHPPGTLGLGQYLDFYQKLAKKYDFDMPASSIASAKEYVDGYNKGRAGLTLPRPDRELSPTEKLLATAADSDIGTAVRHGANALTLGLPEMLAGREARYAGQLADEKHPKSAIAGEVLGSLAPTAGLEGLAARGLGNLIEGPVARKIASEVAGNAAYGGIRGYTGAEPEHRGEEALLGLGVGAAAPLAARGLVKGARGFMGESAREAVDDLAGYKFEMPGERPALPADDITPPRYQGMGDEELRAEIARAQRGVDAWGSQTRMLGENKAAREAVLEEAKRVAASNANRQEVFVRQNFRSTQPDRIDAIRAEAAQLYPTDPAEVLKQPEFASRMKAIVDPSAGSLEPLGTLQSRIARLEEHLSQDATPKTGTVPGVDLTTAQMAGLGSTEEALQGVPFIHGAREKAVASWNRQNSARVLAKIGEELPTDVRPGQDMNAYVNGQLNQAYNRIRPAIRGRMDAPFDNAVAALRKNSVGQSAERQELWGQIEDALQKFRKPDGTFDGNGYRELSTQLRRLSDVWTANNQAAMSTAAQDMARTAEQVRKQAQALVGRANPAAGRRLKQLEAAWAHQVRIEAASRGAAKATRGVYTPDEYLGSIERLDTSRNKAAIARGQGLDQAYAQNARDVLGGKPAKKASIKETAVGAASLHFAGIPAAAVMGTLGLGYIPGAKRVVQAIVKGRLGDTPEAVISALQGSKVGNKVLKGIDADARQKLLQQLIQAESRKSTAQ